MAGGDATSRAGRRRGAREGPGGDATWRDAEHCADLYGDARGARSAGAAGRTRTVLASGGEAGASMSERRLRLGHLYPSLMNIYGDRGNIICLERRCRLRAIDLEVTPLEP